MKQVLDMEVGLLISLAMIIAIAFSLGMCCGCLCKRPKSMGAFGAAWAAAWGEPELHSVRMGQAFGAPGAALVETELHSVLMGMKFEELKGLAKAHRVPHGRNKGAVVSKLVATQKIATELQAKQMLELKVKAFTQGLNVNIAAADISSEIAATSWICKVREDCAK